MEKGAGTFQMPWHSSLGNPINALTGAKYRGINILSLEISRVSRGFSSRYWATFNQWDKLKARIKGGSKSSLVAFYKPITLTDSQNEIEGEFESEEKLENGQKRLMYLRYSDVFNSEQVEGWIPPAVSHDLFDVSRELFKLEEVDSFISSTGADIREGGSRAFYSSVHDFIGIPPACVFTDTAHRSAQEGYYGTLLHELIHWTSREFRCNRSLKGRFGSRNYAEEELVAELGSAFLCSKLGVSVEVRQDHAQYLEHWLKVLQSDNRAIFEASTQASKAVDFLEGLQVKSVPEA